jgi:hypothetical protein
MVVNGPMLQSARGADDPHAKKADKPAKIDLNLASEKELQTLPGIGEAYSKKIIAGRPYNRIKDLAKAGIPAATIEKVAALVSIRTEPKVKPPKKGMVWVNTDSKTYFKEGNPWAGNTKQGKWMSPKDAENAGYKLAN